MTNAIVLYDPNFAQQMQLIEELKRACDAIQEYKKFVFRRVFHKFQPPPPNHRPQRPHRPKTEVFTWKRPGQTDHGYLGKARPVTAPNVIILGPPKRTAETFRQESDKRLKNWLEDQITQIKETSCQQQLTETL